MKTLKNNITIAYLIFTLASFPLLTAISCGGSAQSGGNDDLKKIAKGLLVTAQSVGLAQDTVIEAHAAKLLSTEETRAVLGICKVINRAGVDAVRITRDFSVLGEEERSSLLGILVPLLKTVKDSQTAISIRDPEVREKVRVFLLSVETALNSVQLVLAASGK